MVLIYLIYFLRNRNRFSEKPSLKGFCSFFLRKLKYLFVFLLLSFSRPSSPSNSTELIIFNISRNNDSIGFVEVNRSKIDDVVSYVIDSEVNVRVIFNFKAVGHEKSVYRDDVLVYSSMFRKMNNKLKLNQSLTLEDGKYILDDKGEKQKIQLNSIRHNLVTLLYKEPKGIDEVYCDKFKQMVKVVFLEKGKYKIQLPDRSISVYHYKNDECLKVELKGSFYKVDLIRKFQNVKS